MVRLSEMLRTKFCSIFVLFGSYKKELIRDIQYGVKQTQATHYVTVMYKVPLATVPFKYARKPFF